MPKDEEAPSFQFYPDDFVSDGKVEAMTTEEVGAYILLLCKAWREKPAGTIPNDDKILARWTRMSQSRWLDCKPAVLCPFKACNGGARYAQARLQKEYAKMLSRRRLNRDRATTAATARWNKNGSENHSCLEHATSIPQAMLGDAIPITSPSSSSIPILKQKQKAKDPPAVQAAYPPEVLVFWEAYPATGRNRSSVKECVSAWKTQKCGALADAIMDGLRAWIASVEWENEGGKYVPGAHRFLSKRKWETPPISANGSHVKDATQRDLEKIRLLK
jgi:uncharacterized protein YdaU (DUF1376 family)